MLYHDQTFLGQSAKMKGDHAKESKSSSPAIGMSTRMATRCAGTWAQPTPSHPLPDPSRSESSLQLACLGLCLLWPQCTAPAGFANRISVFALPPGITAEAAGIPLLVSMPTNAAHSKRDLSQHCLLQPPAASISSSDGGGPFVLPFLRLRGLREQGGGGAPQSFLSQWLPKKYISEG